VRRVLVTGATGFIGRHALPLLAERGYEVHAISSSEHSGEAFPFHRANLLDPRASAALVRDVEPTDLLHLAWYSEHGRFWTSPENDRWAEASLELLRAFAESGGRRAVIAGTCAEYDWSGDGLLSEGSTPLAPATTYGAAKHRLHMQASSLAGKAGISLGWGRIFFVYGPGEDPRRLVASVARALIAGEPAPCSHGEHVRDFLHAADVADALTALLAGAIEGPVNIASGEPTKIKDVVAEVARAAGRPELVRLGALPANPDEPPRLVADVRRLGEEVRWKPRSSLEQGIEDTVGWWAKQSPGAEQADP
jgi:nucleoside-diphosphate-sugar epimerase